MLSPTIQQFGEAVERAGISSVDVWRAGSIWYADMRLNEGSRMVLSSARLSDLLAILACEVGRIAGEDTA